jgi:hypothetical protein
VEVAAWGKSWSSSGSGDIRANAAHVVVVRDTADRDGTVLSVSAETWRRFTRTLA